MPDTHGVTTFVITTRPLYLTKGQTLTLLWQSKSDVDVMVTVLTLSGVLVTSSNVVVLQFECFSLSTMFGER